MAEELAIIEGFKDELDYRPGELVRQSVKNGHPVIHIEANYRLGIFGFAQLKVPEDEGSENTGLRDQRLALEWVQQNIRSFGGDPSRVTLQGQSSGGCSVGVQNLAYGASKPFPFHQTIFESEVLDLDITGNSTRIPTVHIVNSTACDRGGLDSPSTVSCLRTLSMDALLDAQHANSNDVWRVAVDGPDGFLPEAPSSLMRQGRFAQVPSIISWCENDGSFFVANNASDTDVVEYFASYLPALTNDSLEQLLALYPTSEFNPIYGPGGSIAFTAQGNRAARIIRDILLPCQPMHYGQAIAETGAPVYTYLQNAILLTRSLEGRDLYGYGVFHTSEIFYVFGNFTSLTDNYAINFTSADHGLRTRQTRSWTSFASVGHPSIVGEETLQGWELANFTDQNFGAYVIGGFHAGNAGTGGSEAAISAVQQQKLQERCAFINSPQTIAQLQY